MRIYLRQSEDGGVDIEFLIPPPNHGRARGYSAPGQSYAGVPTDELRELLWIDLDETGAVIHREPRGPVKP